LNATGDAKAQRRDGRMQAHIDTRNSSAEALLPALVTR
jgi:hypothetical protein